MADVMIFDSKLKEEGSYWLERLAGVGTTTTMLDPDHTVSARFGIDDAPPLPADIGGRRLRGRLNYCFDAELTAHLHRLTGSSPFLIYTALVSGLKVCLRRYTGAAEVAVGSPPLAECSQANTLVIVNEVRDQESFRELLLRVRQSLLGAYAHQRYPYRRLLKEVGMANGQAGEGGNAKRSRLFDVAVELEGFHGRFVEADENLRLRFKEEISESDIGEEAASASKALSVSIDYDDRQYSHHLITRFIVHYEEILRRAVSDANQRVRELEMLSAEERRLLLVEWNQTERPYPNDRCVHQLFAEQAERTPEQVALVSEGSQLSYQELNRRANQLGHYLCRRGVRPEVVVGLCMDRSVEMVVATIGVLKAGGAYLPLDPEYPQERLGYMLEDIGVGVALTRRELKDRLPAFDGQMVLLDEECERISEESESEPESKVVAGNLAYAMYTSGSTGRPKGVMVEHKGLCNLVEAQKEAFRLGSRSRVLQFASLSFDASVSEIFCALTAGGSLHIHARESLMPGDDLARVLREDQITVMTLPPTVLGVMKQEELLGLQTLIAAGEDCGAEIVERWARGRRFLNAYGPTEATVCASIGECEAESKGKPAIGQPIANTRLYVLNRAMEPAPVGGRGELYIAGVSLARGYWGRPDITAERFIPNPFSHEGGERLYRTGDIVRRRMDGNLVFLGRADDQVKIRGYRIEPGELERVLREAPWLREAAVITREDAPGEKRLVGYVVWDESRAGDTGEVRSYLKRRLPEYMMPSALVALERLPLTANGKVDRKALPAPEGRPEGVAYVAPRTPMEEMLTEIWSELLHVERIGIRDDFFELGGDSLLATRLISQIWKIFRLNLPMRSLFESRTIVHLAPIIVQHQVEQAQTVDVESVLGELDQLSDEEVKALLINETRQTF